MMVLPSNAIQLARRWFEADWNGRNGAAMREIIDLDACGLVESG
jgi:hypothetical protein